MTGIEAKVTLRKELEGITLGYQLTPKQQEAMRIVAALLAATHGKDVLEAMHKAAIWAAGN